MSDDNHRGDRLLTSSEVAEMFRVHPRTPSRWAREGRVNSIQTLGGGQRRYWRSEIEKLLSEGETDGHANQE